MSFCRNFLIIFFSAKLAGNNIIALFCAGCLLGNALRDFRMLTAYFEALDVSFAVFISSLNVNLCRADFRVLNIKYVVVRSDCNVFSAVKCERNGRSNGASGILLFFNIAQRSERKILDIFKLGAYSRIGNII